MDYFQQCSCLEINSCALFHYFPYSNRKLLKLPNLELKSLLSRFYGLVQNNKSKNGVNKTNIDCSFIQEMVENYCTHCKIQPWSTIHQGPHPNAAFRLACHSPYCCIDGDICTTAQVPLALVERPSGEQRQANQSITSSLCPKWETADS